jgi:hypothetical protein
MGHHVCRRRAPLSSWRAREEHTENIVPKAFTSLERARRWNTGVRVGPAESLLDTGQITKSCKILEKAFSRVIRGFKSQMAPLSHSYFVVIASQNVHRYTLLQAGGPNSATLKHIFERSAGGVKGAWETRRRLKRIFIVVLKQV